MERYTILEEIGDGTCGSVYKAVNNETSEIVAVKRMKRKFFFWEECVNLREVKALRRLNHPNVSKLREIVRQNNELFFIFEYMECNLYHMMKDQQRSFSEEEIRALMSQVLQGLAHVHKHGYFHRDLKPENLLVTNNTIKIADFGLARELSSAPPFTDYVSTRWYRAPEVLLQSASYTPAIDMWAVGAILAELFTLCPIFPGESEMDQLYKICRVLGAPQWNIFPEAINISRLFKITCSDTTHPASLSAIIPNASAEAIDLIKQLFSWDPLKRPTADQCLQHPFFHVGKRVPRPVGDTLQLGLGHSEPNLELNLWDFGTSTDDCFLGLTLAVKPSAPNLDWPKKVRCQRGYDDLQSSFGSLKTISFLVTVSQSTCNDYINGAFPISIFQFSCKYITISRIWHGAFSVQSFGPSLTRHIFRLPPDPVVNERLVRFPSCENTLGNAHINFTDLQL